MTPFRGRSNAPDASLDDEKNAFNELAFILRMCDGDEYAFTRLVRHYIDALTRFAFYIIRSRDIADDVVQDVFVALWERRETIDPTRSLKSYLFSAVRNRALNEQKSIAVRTRYIDAVLQDGGDEAGDRPTAVLNLEERILTHETIQAALRQLPERRQLALRLRFEDELSNAEIATVLGISPEAAQRFVYRAVTELRQMLRISD